MNAFLLSKKYILITVLFIIISLAGIYVLVLNKNEQKNISVLPAPTVVTEPTVVTLPPTPEYAADQVIIKFKMGQSIDEIKDENKKKELVNSLQELGMESWEKLYKNTQDTNLKNYFILKLKKGTSVLGTVEKLKDIKEIENAEPNYIQRAL